MPKIKINKINYVKLIKPYLNFIVCNNLEKFVMSSQFFKLRIF